MTRVPGPDFVIIGAMKCATTTLHDQLALQPGIFMSTPKEPCFFSDDDVYARGIGWYRSLFEGAGPGDIRGESSTHYTKLPTHPRSVERMVEHIPDARLIYVMRHPIERLISQYVHEWSMRTLVDPIDRAVDTVPALVDYGRYDLQIAPFLRAWGPERVLPVFFERLTAEPAEELNRVGRFIGCRSHLTWTQEAGRRNAGEQRLRRTPLRDFLVNTPMLKTLRRTLVPRSVRERVKRLWSIGDRPVLSPAMRMRLERIYDEDLARLGDRLGVQLSCATWGAVASGPAPMWGTCALADSGRP